MFDYRFLCLHGGTDGIHGAREFHQHAVAHQFYDSAVVLSNLWIEEIGTQDLESGERAFLVCADQPRVADHVSGHDGGESARHWNPN